MALTFKTEAAYQAWLAQHTQPQQPPPSTIVPQLKPQQRQPVLRFDSTTKTYTVHKEGCTTHYITHWFSTSSQTDWPLELFVLYSVLITLLLWCIHG